MEVLDEVLQQVDPLLDFDLIDFEEILQQYRIQIEAQCHRKQKHPFHLNVKEISSRSSYLRFPSPV